MKQKTQTAIKTLYQQPVLGKDHVHRESVLLVINMAEELATHAQCIMT